MIPTFREEQYIVKTLDILSKQNAWISCEVVIADYDPDGRPIADRPIYKVLADQNREDFKKINIVNVNRKGIGFARHAGIVHSRGDFIVNFDADARFIYTNSIRELVKAIVFSDNKIIMTHCPNTLDLDEIETSSIQNIAYNVRSWLQDSKLLPIAYEPGMTLTKMIYNRVGGFRDVVQLEGPLLAWDLGVAVGFNKIKQLNNFPVVVSARRAKAAGFIEFNYDRAFRGDQEIKIEG